MCSVMYPLCSCLTFSWADWCALSMKHLVLGFFEPKIKLAHVCVCACVYARVSRRHSGYASACRTAMFYAMKLMQIMHTLWYGTWTMRILEGINFLAYCQRTFWWGAIQSLFHCTFWKLFLEQTSLPEHTPNPVPKGTSWFGRWWLDELTFVQWGWQESRGLVSGFGSAGTFIAS